MMRITDSMSSEAHDVQAPQLHNSRAPFLSTAAVLPFSPQQPCSLSLHSSRALFLSTAAVLAKNAAHRRMQAAAEMCDICIEVEGGDGDSILASAQVTSPGSHTSHITRRTSHALGGSLIQLRIYRPSRFPDGSALCTADNCPQVQRTC
jgi:hypothetical protein